MIGPPDVRSVLDRILANDSSRYLPRSAPIAFDPHDSWSGAEFVRWESDSGPMILKIWPIDGPDLLAHRQRHLLLQGLEGFQPALSLPLPNLSGATLRILPDGRAAELFRWLEGHPVSSHPSYETTREVMKTIARLHAWWVSANGRNHGIPDSVLQRFRQLHAMKSAGFDAMLREVAQSRSWHDDIRRKFIETIERAARWTPIALRVIEPLTLQPLPLQTVLRDVRPNHFLTEGGKIRALVDLGTVGTDSVALDLARISGEWLLFDSWQRDRAIRAYEEVLPLTPGEVAAIDPIMAASTVLGALAWVDIQRRRNRSGNRDKDILIALTHAETRLKRLDERLSIR